MPKDSLTVAEAKEMLLQVADKIIESEPILTDADRALGDGDHGIGMARGMNAVKEKLGDVDFESLDKLFMNMGMAMTSSMGGASGAIFGTLFMKGGKALAGKDTLDAEGLAALLKEGCEGVMARGGAKPGDKTMIDALNPAAEKAAEVLGSGLSKAAKAVAEAGEAGRDASCDMIATMGRAKTLGENSLGKPDAGACSIAIILRTISDFVE
ncbi:MAG: dihydroxyacetone kinase subunit DhaL [Verrucomicrobiota bacterium]